VVEPTWRWCARQHCNPLAFGSATLHLVPALVKSRKHLREKANGLLLCFLGSAVCLSYSHRIFHFSFQFATDIYVPLVLVVTAGIGPSAVEWVRRQRASITILVFFLVFNSLTAFALTGEAVMLVIQKKFLVERSMLDAFAWLNNNSRDRDVVFADAEISNQIPRYSRGTVFYGYYNAVRAEQKLAEINKFFDPQPSETSRNQLVCRTGAKFILLTEHENRELSSIKDSQYFKEVFKNDSAVIYLVRSSCDSNEKIQPVFISPT
jgi:hypothetical protein